MSQENNRRLFDRVKMSLSTQGQSMEEWRTSHHFAAQTRDASPRGLGLSVTDPDRFKAGQSVRISVSCKEDESPIQVLGLIRWISNPEDALPQPALGVELTGMASVRDYDRWIRMLNQDNS